MCYNNTLKCYFRYIACDNDINIDILKFVFYIVNIHLQSRTWPSNRMISYEFVKFLMKLYVTFVNKKFFFKFLGLSLIFSES